MRKMIALFISTAFLLGTTGFAVAQTATPAPAQEKKPAPKAMSMEEKKAACLDKAGSDEAKKADCEKKFVAKPKTAKTEATAEKKEEKK